MEKEGLVAKGKGKLVGKRELVGKERSTVVGKGRVNWWKKGG
jgi:hypothetical protein